MRELCQSFKPIERTSGCRWRGVCCQSSLVRGLDYYTKTAFEIQYPPLGAQSAVCGGGRYDGLVEEMGGDPTPGIGFAIGLERVLIALGKARVITASR